MTRWRFVPVLFTPLLTTACVSDAAGTDSGAADTGVATDGGNTDTGTGTDSGTTDSGISTDSSVDQDSGPPPWTPQSLAGLKVWLDGSNHNDAQKITLDMANKVTSWKDLSGSNNHATPYPAANPTISVSVFANGKDSVKFADVNGAGPALVQLTDKATLQWGTNDFVVAFVMRSFNAPAGQDEYGGYAILYAKQKGGWPYYGVNLNANVPTGSNPFFFGGIKSAADPSPAPGAVSQQVINDGKFHRLIARRISSSTMSVYVDGQVTTKMGIDTASADAAGGDVNIGGYHGNVLVNAPLKGDIAEIVCASAQMIPDGDVTKLDAYLATKYGL